MAREVTTLILWIILAGMLTVLARRLWAVAQKHLADSDLMIQLALPGLAVLASIGSMWKARRNWAEFQDIRREQSQLVAELQSEMDASPES